MNERGSQASAFIVKKSTGKGSETLLEAGAAESPLEPSLPGMLGVPGRRSALPRARPGKGKHQRAEEEPSRGQWQGVCDGPSSVLETACWANI